MSEEAPLDHSPGQTPGQTPEQSQPTVAWRDVPGWHSVALGLRLMGIALVVGLVSLIVHRIWQTDLSQQMRATDDLDTMQNLFETMRLGWQIFPGVGLMCMAAIGVGVWRMTRASISQTDNQTADQTAEMITIRNLGVIACIAIAAELVYNGLWWIQAMSEKPQPWLDFLMKPWSPAILAIATGIYVTAILALLMRLSAAARAPMSHPLIIAMGAWIAWEVGFPLYIIITEGRPDMATESPWMYLTLTLGVSVLGQALLLLAVVRLANALRRPAPAELADQVEVRARAAIALPGDWSEAASGLELYTSALSWRVFGTIGGYLMLMFGIFGRSQPLVKMVMFAMPVIALITAVAMLVGIARFARQPSTCDAGSTAWVAAVIMGLGLLLDGYSLILVIRQLSIDMNSWSAYKELQDIAEQTQAISMWAMGLGFVSLLSLMISFGQLARYIKRPDLHSRVISIGLFMAFVAVVVLCFRSYAGDAKGDPDGILVLAIMIIITAVIAVFAYLNLVNNIAQALRPAPNSSDLPTARIVS